MQLCTCCMLPVHAFAKSPDVRLHTHTGGHTSPWSSPQLWRLSQLLRSCQPRPAAHAVLS